MNTLLVVGVAGVTGRSRQPAVSAAAPASSAAPVAPLARERRVFSSQEPAEDFESVMSLGLLGGAESVRVDAVHCQRKPRARGGFLETGGSRHLASQPSWQAPLAVPTRVVTPRPPLATVSLHPGGAA